MTARDDFDRQLDAFLSDGPTELPDPSFYAVRHRTESTRQRVVIGPWRMPDPMNRFAAIGLGTAAVVVALVVGMQVLRPSAPGGVGGAPSAAPSPTPARTGTTAPSQSPTSATPLSQSFTSTMHGFSVSYPGGWVARAATEPWTDRPAVAEFSNPGLDVLQDPVLGDHLFLNIASRPIGDTTPADWMAQQLSGYGCTATDPIAVDGVTGRIGANDCDIAAVTTAGHGYLIQLTKSSDDPPAVAAYDRAWFEDVLATVKLHPEDAVDAKPSSSP
jgi:hypothetical protein